MRLLILQHVPHEHPGYIARYATEKGIPLDVIELWRPYSIPALKGYSGIIVLGGPMGVYEDFPSKSDEIRFIQQSIGAIPLLGICLGSQLLAHALGAEVHPNANGKEIGYYTVELTEAGKKDRIFRGSPHTVQVLEWHGDAFELPEGANLLATSPVCTNQAFSFKNAFGFLFHFEFTPEMIRRQSKMDSEWAHKNFDLDEPKLFNEAAEFAPLMEQQCYRLLDNFLVT